SDVTTGFSNHVDIYDVRTGQWSTTTLSDPRANFATAVVGDKAIIFGGTNASGPSNAVDIYDARNGFMSNVTLPAGEFPRARVVGTKAFFVGGHRWTNNVEIFDASTGGWTTATLPHTVGPHSIVTVGSKVLFADGSGWLDIYDTTTGQWSSAAFPNARTN